MTTAAAFLVLLAGAALCWPSRVPAHRLRALLGGRPTRPARPRRGPGRLLTVAMPSLAALAVCGPGAALAAAVGAATLHTRWRHRNRARGELAAAESMADAVQGLVTELRAGAHPVAAAEAAARDAREPAAAVLATVAATARLGGDLATALHRFTDTNPAIVPALRPLVHAWDLAHRHGLPLADVLDSVWRDVSTRVRFAGRVRARLAGPRASGAVLAGLPLLGILLGEAMGADPLRVLLGTGAGQALLAVGVCLACAGVGWVARLTSRVGSP